MSLRISSDLSLPLDVAGEAIGLLATRGAGKSYTSAVLVEELYAAGVQVIVLDPTGVYWGLRGSGEKEGLPLYVFGGAHGDVPLEATAGTLFADLAVDEEQSFVLDLSDFPTKGDQTKFVTAFAERLYRRKARARTTTHLIVDEADEFAPQRTMGNLEPRMLGAMEALVRRGRSRGLGVTLITQRSAALNKNVLDLVETLIVLRTLGPRDRKAIEGWVSVKDLSDELGVLDSLPGLPTGTGWVWSPVREILEKVAIRSIRTFDSYRTPKPGEARSEPKEIAPIDLDSLGEKIRATAEKAKAEDPRELRRQIAELRRELESRPTEAVVEERIVQERVEVPVLAPGNTLETVLLPVLERTPELLERATDELRAVLARFNGKEDDRVIAPARPATRPERTARPHRAEPHPTPTPAREADTSGVISAVTPAKQRILDALAALEAIGVEQAHKTQLALFAKASPKSSSYANNLGALRSAGLVDYPGPSLVALTHGGRSIADPGNVPTTNDELWWYVKSLVGPAKARILDALIVRHPNPVERDALAEIAGSTATSSGYANNLGSLRSLGLIDYPTRGFVAATPVLFIE